MISKLILNLKNNSVISPGVSYEYEVDLMFMSQNDANIGLVAVDKFSKFAHIVVIKNKQPDEIIRGLKEIIDKMGKPKQLYSDEEGSFNALKYIRFLNENNIKHVQTTTHAHTVESFVQTFRNNLQRRLDGLKQDKSDWVKNIDPILKNIIIQIITLYK